MDSPRAVSTEDNSMISFLVYISGEFDFPGFPASPPFNNKFSPTHFTTNDQLALCNENRWMKRYPRGFKAINVRGSLIVHVNLYGLMTCIEFYFEK
jgi:hypothetical protein